MENFEIFYRANQNKSFGGTPPLSFKSNGDPITNYMITGAAGGVGEKTPQLIDQIVQGAVDSGNGAILSSENRVRTNMIPVDGGATYTLFCGNQYTAAGCFYNDGVFVKSISNYGLKRQITFTVPAGANGFLTSFMKQNASQTLTPSEITGYMLNKGDAQLPTEPYGYKIPVQCGGETTDIYIGNSTLGAGESVTYDDTGIAIATARGENTLTVDTTVQPASVIIKVASTLPRGLDVVLRQRYDMSEE